MTLNEYIEQINEGRKFTLKLAREKYFISFSFQLSFFRFWIFSLLYKEKLSGSILAGFGICFAAHVNSHKVENSNTKIGQMSSLLLRTSCR